MENFFATPTVEKSYEKITKLTLEEKIQKLINMCVTYKENYDSLKKEYEKNVTSNIELEDEKTQLINEKHHLEMKMAQLSEELQFKTAEVGKLKEMNAELDSITQAAVERIDRLLSECEFEV